MLVWTSDKMSFTHKNTMIPFARAAELSSRAGSWEEPSWSPCQIKFSSASGGRSLCILSVRTPTLLKWTRGMCLAPWIEAKDMELKLFMTAFPWVLPFFLHTTSPGGNTLRLWGILRYKSSIDDLGMGFFYSFKLVNSNIFLSTTFQNFHCGFSSWNSLSS